MPARNERYRPWLEIADQLARLHEFAYGESGPFHSSRDRPIRPTGLDAASWLRRKCSSGQWYWWDKASLYAKAQEPLRSMWRVVGDLPSSYMNSENHQELCEQIKQIEQAITLAKGK